MSVCGMYKTMNTSDNQGSQMLAELASSIANEWDECASTGKMCIGSLDAFGSNVKTNKQVTIYCVDVSEFSQTGADILLGFGTKPSAADICTDIQVTLGERVIAEAKVFRGRRCMLQPSPISKIGLPSSPKLTIHAPASGVFAICATCNDDTRHALAKEHYAWGA